LIEKAQKSTKYFRNSFYAWEYQSITSSR
jgi:hypothetical protein